MPDFTDSFLPGVLAYRLPEIELGDGLIHPNYQGGSILNLPSTLAALFDLPKLGAPALSAERLDLLRQGNGIPQRIVFIVMDALGFLRFRRWLEERKELVWNRLIANGAFLPLTSIVPSTTTAALLSLWSGRSPAEHGVAGYELWLKEYGVVANMITHKPADLHGPNTPPGSLVDGGFDPGTYLPYPTLGTHLAAGGVKTAALQHSSIVHSGLSQMFFKDVEVYPYGSPAEMWINLRQLIEARQTERLLAYVYWSEVDTLSHRYGPMDERVPAEIELWTQAFERHFLDRLPAALRKDTLLLVTADHGQVPVQRYPHYELRNHPGLSRRLHIQPTGESRLAYLYPRPGQIEAVREYVDRTWPKQFLQLDPGFAVEAGLFGPGTPHPRLLDRLGDLILASRGEAYLWANDRDDPMRGRHGSLTPDEMLVPLLGCWF